MGKLKYFNSTYFEFEIHFVNKTFLINLKNNFRNIQNYEIGFKLASLLYYLNFCVNFLLYSFKKRKSTLLAHIVI